MISLRKMDPSFFVLLLDNSKMSNVNLNSQTFNGRYRNNFSCAAPEIAALEQLCGELKAEKEKSTQTQIALVTAFSDLQRSIESSKRELEVINSNLKHDLDVERQKAAENALALQDAMSDRNKAEELAESFRQKLLAVEDEMDLEQTSLKEKINLEKKLLESDAALKRSNEKLRTIEAKFVQSQEISFKTLSDLKSSKDNDRRKLEDTITNLKRELDAKKKQVSELTVSLRQVTEEKSDAIERAESFQQKVSIMETEAVFSQKKHDKEKQILEKNLKDRVETIKLVNNKLQVLKNSPVQVHPAPITSVPNDNVEMESVIADLKSELEVEKQRTSLKAVSIQALTLSRNEANKLAESLQIKVTDLETEVKNLTKSKEILAAEGKECKSVLADNRQRFEKEKQTLLRNQMLMASQKSKLTLEIQELLSSNTELKDECNSVKKEKLEIMAQLEEVQREYQSLRNKFYPPVVELSDSDVEEVG